MPENDVRELAERLIRHHFDRGIDSLTAHECDAAQGFTYDKIEEARDHANWALNHFTVEGMVP